MNQDLDANYWQQRYEANQTGWDAGAITPPLKNYFDQLSDKSLRILIPGCGHAYEAEYLHAQGFTNVFVVDVAPAPLAHFAARVPDFPEAHLLHQDFFSLNGKYDLMVEQTFFCALQPALRPAYAAKCAELLQPGGKLMGLLFDTAFAQDGPPFGGSRAEYRLYFAPYFNFIHFDTACNSIKPRQERELLILLEVKSKV